MTILSLSGPWGSVRCEVKCWAGAYSVSTWINGQVQMPNYGLDRAEAFELADDLVQLRSAELEAEFLRKAAH